MSTDDGGEGDDAVKRPFARAGRRLDTHYSTEKRFWEKVNKSDPDECWMWESATTTDDYGRFWIAGTVRMAHRVAYRFTTGSIDEDEVIRHLCGTPGCVNPNHLTKGSQTQNLEDSDRFLNSQDKQGVRLYYWGTNMTQEEVGELFGVSQRAVSEIVNR